MNTHNNAKEMRRCSRFRGLIDRSGPFNVATIVERRVQTLEIKNSKRPYTSARTDKAKMPPGLALPCTEMKLQEV